VLQPSSLGLCAFPLPFGFQGGPALCGRVARTVCMSKWPKASRLQRSRLVMQHAADARVGDSGRHHFGRPRRLACWGAGPPAFLQEADCLVAILRSFGSRVAEFPAPRLFRFLVHVCEGWRGAFLGQRAGRSRPRHAA